ncbi:hypothetical protein [Herbiconiux sp.]|uniref:hypothetical protein n=1 Tax=Herbiconiux sp. TaxID=1871186 RepID=UPI0025BF602A|nr:hypothetical protein [Herbiconiux sp.]
MKNPSWAAYGLGVLVVVFVLMSGELAVLPKSLIVVSTLFVGALIAAIHELARAFADSKKVTSPEASPERVETVG